MPRISAACDEFTSRARGFTLLELLVVIAIMAALTVAFPLALNRFMPARRADASARELLSDIRLAQSRSVAVNQPVLIEPAANGYRMSIAGDSDATVIVERAWLSSTRLSLHTLDNSRELSAARVFPDGSSTGARFRIRDGKHARTVSISELTSRVRIVTGEEG